MNQNLTYTTTLTTKYQTVLPAPLRKLIKLKEKRELVWKLLKQKPWPIILVSPKPQIENWSQYLSGLGKEVWQGVNTEKYLKNIKKEWQK